MLKSIVTQHQPVAAAEEQADSLRRREAVEHKAVKLLREVFGEVSLQEPELENG
jgi:hypothetical protein